ncbi:HlyD family type I secretion periplasmic adaptor subunit [Sedimentimonas flavescens]|uniref:HlyD family type I secretion periplasmic adaptor subunit n=1 Tax=Sedimentimonas flavescens TaxID=2851012 RepID=UPI001C4A1097|nr:HlyD family type I secretion periplasmic adaptor subunit [Sedimentimonas flavescens]MBW0159149.1 HlyD family type I secretion periplasmic adaptor subunit [Sedimentimonas flavescens]
MSLPDAEWFRAALGEVLSKIEGATGSGAYVAAAGVALLLGGALWMVFRRRAGTGVLAGAVRGPVLTGLVALGLFIGVMGMWSWLVPLAGAAVAPGVFSPMGDTKTVQHLEGGIVKEILVADGSKVTAGAPLILLDDTETRGELSAKTERYIYLLAVEARLAAELQGTEMHDPPAAFADLPPEAMTVFSGQQELLQTRRTTQQARENVLLARAEQLRTTAHGIEGVVEAKNQELDILRGEIATARDLYDKGLQRLPQVLALERESASVRSEIAQSQTEIARIGEQVAETQLQMQTLREEMLEAASSELAQTRAELALTRSDLPAYRDRLERLVIRAPVSGTVANMQVATMSGVIKPGQALLDIVPADIELLAEARVRPTDIDRIYTGMRVRVVLTAYRQRNLPQIFGQVRSVSADRIIDERTDVPYFMADVSVDQEALRSLPDVVLTSGMPVEIIFLDDEQTLLSYLLDPVRTSFNRSFVGH